ncbi:MAG TPA: alanine--glyoxylate aminotransferase family protein [Anaerolineales bacterium]|nr:alanine--glyoxylate aminotransferase family protein [Anaerolineales bacterium]
MTESSFSIPRHRLFIPGPVEVDETVLAEMGGPVVAHYGREWTALYKETTNRMKEVFRTEGDVFLLVASGSGGLEAAVASLFAPGERVIVGVNGFFGERLATIARMRGLAVVEVIAPWGKAISVDDVRDALRGNWPIAGLLVNHHETSTGVLNPIQSLGGLAGEFDIPYVVDAISSLGGEVLAMDDWGIDICVGASQKCLEAPPGLAPVAVSRRAWEIMERKGEFPAGWYLNLRIWRKYAQEWGEWHPFPVTLPTNIVLAFRAALDRLLEEGLEAHMSRYREAAQFVRTGLRELGFDLYVDGEIASTTLTAVRRLPSMDISDLIGYLLEERGIRVAGGLGATRGEIFRIGHMGKAAHPGVASLVLDALRAYLAERGGHGGE